ncbi:MAG: DUF2312 domain-containing protein [Alphaproteobacteria bacterium]|nr:DUF2312 domain-containing protein [Alphaproteobacteria bacterium]
MTRQIAGVTGEFLLQYIQRIERLEQDKATVSEDIKSVYAEAKNNGFDTKIMKQVVKLRKMDPNERDEQETLLDIYKQAIGMMVNEMDVEEA